MAVLRGRLLLLCLCVLVTWDTNVIADPVRDAVAAESQQIDVLARLFEQFHEADGAAVSNKEGNSREAFADSSLRASQMMSKTQRMYQNLKRHTQTYRSQLQHSADTINKELTSVNSLLMQAASVCVGNKQSLFAMLKESLSTQFDRTLSGPVKQAEQAVDQLESELTEYKEVVENNMDKVKRLQRKCQSSFSAKRRQTRGAMPFPTLTSPSPFSLLPADSTQPDRIQAVVASINDSLQQLQTLLRKAVEMGKATADPSSGCVSAFHKMVVQMDATMSSQSSSLQEMDQTAKSAVAATRAYTSVQGMFSQIHDLVMDCERSRADSDEVDPAGVRIAGGSVSASGNSILMPPLNLHGGTISDSSTGAALKQSMTFNVGAQSDSRVQAQAAAFGGSFVSGGGGGGGGSTIIFAPYYGRGSGCCPNDTASVHALGNLSPAVLALQGLSTSGMASIDSGASPKPPPGLPPPSSDPIPLAGPKSPPLLLPPSTPEPVTALLDEASHKSVPVATESSIAATAAPAAAVVGPAQTETHISAPPVPRFISVPSNTSSGTQPQLATTNQTQSKPDSDTKLAPRSPLTLALHEHRLWSMWADRQNHYVSLVPHSPVLPRFVPKTELQNRSPEVL